MKRKKNVNSNDVLFKRRKNSHGNYLIKHIWNFLLFIEWNLSRYIIFVYGSDSSVEKYYFL